MAQSPDETGSVHSKTVFKTESTSILHAKRADARPTLTLQQKKVPATRPPAPLTCELFANGCAGYQPQSLPATSAGLDRAVESAIRLTERNEARAQSREFVERRQRRRDRVVPDLAIAAAPADHRPISLRRHRRNSEQSNGSQSKRQTSHLSHSQSEITFPGAFIHKPNFSASAGRNTLYRGANVPRFDVSRKQLFCPRVTLKRDDFKLSHPARAYV